MHNLFRNKMYYWLAGGAVACVALYFAYSHYSAAAPAAEDLPPLVRTLKVGAAEATGRYVYSGEVRGRYESQLAFPINTTLPYNGKIIRRNVDVGSMVKPGEVLMVMDAQSLQQTADIYSAQVSASNSQLNLAQTNRTRYRQLFAQGAVSRAVLDQYESAYDVALAGVHQSQAQYNQSSYQVASSVISADAPGVISSISAEVGQVVNAGQPVITLVRDGEREIEIAVPENRLADLRTASQITVTCWALPGTVVQGKIREISPIADTLTRTYRTRISLINPPPTMKLGMTATVTVLDSAGGKTTIYIPLSAVYQTQNKPGVWVVKNGVASLQPVTLGEFGDNAVQVCSGLNVGDVVITAGVHMLRQGEKVRTTGGDLP
jgi:membrane fusion protein, multidrug efflux system